MTELEILIRDLGHDDGYSLNVERRFKAHEIINDLSHALSNQPGAY